jgi:Arm DNA-binding domain
LRVTDRGHKSFILAARYPMHPKTNTAGALGMVGSLTVNAARDKARRWLDLISKEIDSKIGEERLRAEAKALPGRDLRAGRQRFSRSACRQVRQGERGSIIETEPHAAMAGSTNRRCPAGDVSQAIRSILARGCPGSGPQRRCRSVQPVQLGDCDG